MRARIAPLAFLISAACAPAIAVVDGKGGTNDGGIDLGDTGSDTDADTDTDGGGDADTDGGDTDVDPGPSTEDWAGEWFALVELVAETGGGGCGGGGWGGQSIECSGELSLEFADDGGVDGSGSCSIGGWAEAGLEFFGDVTADGELEGVLVFSQDWVGEAELDVDGAAVDESEIDSDVDGIIVLGGWGGDYEVPLVGTMIAER